jgi:hypothetical protein
MLKDINNMSSSNFADTIYLDVQRTPFESNEEENRKVKHYHF